MVVQLGRGRIVVAVLAALSALAPARAAIPEDRTLLLYNSQNADSLAVRNMYVAARPGVRQFDLNNATLLPGAITRTDYLTKIRAPLLAFLAGTTTGGTPLSQHIIAIATTRGLPARINGTNEFDISSSFSSLESDLALVQQDLEAVGAGSLPFRFNGICNNPYYRRFNQPIDGFSRSSITTPRTFQFVNPGVWNVVGLTPGDIYLACRLDAAPSAGATALQNVQALITRSQNLRVNPCRTQGLLDEWGCANHLDDDAFTFLFPSFPDFENTRTLMVNAGFPMTHDFTATFVTMPMLPTQNPLIALGTYGVNHSVNGCGQGAANGGLYPLGYTYHSAACFISYESFNGNSLIDGNPRGGHAQVLDFISAGGSFSVAHVAEPFTFSVAKLEGLTRQLYVHGMTFAEAAYVAVPGLSWQQTPVGDPLARVVPDPGPCPGDANGDNRVDFQDLNIVLSQFGQAGVCLQGDVQPNGVVDFGDLNLVLSNFGVNC